MDCFTEDRHGHAQFAVSDFHVDGYFFSTKLTTKKKTLQLGCTRWLGGVSSFLLLHGLLGGGFGHV